MVVQIASPKCPWADSEEGAATLEQPQGKKQGFRACKARQGSPTATQAPFTARHPACSWLGVEVGAPEPALARGARGGDGVLPNPHITEALSPGQATLGLSDAKGTKQQFATLHPQPPSRASGATEGGSGPRPRARRLPRALTFPERCAMVHLGRLECGSAGVQGAPDIAGGALLAQRRPDKRFAGPAG